MANSDFIFNLAFRTEGSEEIKQVQDSLETLLSSQQRITATSRQQGTAQKSLTTENRNLAQAVEASAKILDRQRNTLKFGSKEYVANNQAAAALRNSLNTLNTTNDRYNSTVVGNQKREQRRKEALIASSGATQKLEQETKSFISSLGQSTSMTERNVNEASQLISKIDEQVASNQKLQRSVGLTRKQQASLLKEEQRLIKTKESLQNRVSGTANRFEQFKRSAAAARADLQRLSADNLRAGETTESHKEEQQRLEQVLQDLGIEFKMLAEAGELSEQQMTQMSSALAGVKGQALQTDRNLKGMSQAFTGQTKATNSANQILLSFGDIAQDSAQFQFGFAQGMRAIGNNVTFVAEQFTIFAAKTAAANGGTLTMKSAIDTMKKALRGPAGLVVILSAAVTVITVMSGALKKNKKRAEEAADGISEYADAIKTLRGLVTPDVTQLEGLLQEESQVERLVELVRERSELEREINASRLEAANLSRNALDPTQQILAAASQRAEAEAQLERVERLIKLSPIDIGDKGLKELEAALEGIRQNIENVESGAGGFRAQLGLLADTARNETSLAITSFELGLNNSEEALRRQIKTLDEQIKNYKNLANSQIITSEQQEIYIELLKGLTEQSSNAKDALEALNESQENDIFLRDRAAIRQMNLLRAESIEDEKKRIEEVAKVRRDNLKQRAIDEKLTPQEIALAEMQIEMETNQALKELRDQSLQDKRDELLKRLNMEREHRLEVIEAEKEHANLRLSIEKQLSQSRQQVNQQLITSLQSSFSALFGQNKAVALLNLAVEKGLAIAKVIADAREKASELQAEAAALRTKGAIAGMTGNPAQSAQFFAAAATATAGSVKTLATGKKNAAKIAAIGLLQGASALGGGGGGGGGSASGGGGSSSAFGMQEVDGEQRFRTPQYQPRRTEDSRGAETNVQIMADRKQLYALVNKGQQEYNGIKTRTTATS